MNDNVEDRENAQNPSVPEGEQRMISIGETSKKIEAAIKDAEKIKRSKIGKCYKKAKQAIIKNFMSSEKETTDDGVTNNTITKGNKIKNGTTCLQQCCQIARDAW